MEKSSPPNPAQATQASFLKRLWANSTLYQRATAITAVVLLTFVLYFVFSLMGLRAENQAQQAENSNPLLVPPPSYDPKKESNKERTGSEYDQRQKEIEAAKLKPSQPPTQAYTENPDIYASKAPLSAPAGSPVKKVPTADEQEAQARSRPSPRSTPKPAPDWGRTEKAVPEKEVAKEGDVFNTHRVSADEASSYNRNFADRNPTTTLTNSPAPNERNTRKKRVFIGGVVHGTQTVHSGQSVRFRLIEDASIEGIFVPKHTLISALAYLSGSRVTFQVSAVQLENQTLPVKLITYDQDMNIGLAYDSDNPIQSQTRSETEGAVDQGVNDALSYVPYAGALNTGKNLARGVARAVSRGGNQKKRQEIALLDGYKVYFTEATTNQ